jgi:uncharacterized protein
MIIEFKVKNFRSLKDEVKLSLEASGAKGKADNVAEIQTENGQRFRLLKTAVIYGPNASGKSNIIKAFWAFRQLIGLSFRYDVNDQVNLAEPFQLSKQTESEPTEFTLDFIAWDNQRYIYFISFTKDDGIYEETLRYYPEKVPKTIYRRKARKIVSKSDDFFSDVVISNTINPKRLLLSELGNTGNQYWENLRNYFVMGNTVINSSATGMSKQIAERAKRVFESDDPKMKKIQQQVIRLVGLSDLGVKNLGLTEEETQIKSETEELISSGENYSETKKFKRFKTYHDVYENGKVTGKKEFDLIMQGSVGTFSLVGLSTEILISLNFEHSRPVWIDEIDNSLHPYLCRFLISLFNHPKSNPRNAQLIFVTHETSLLDKNNFRKDQIWITTKDKYGVTQLYSVSDLDMEGLRDDIPFDKWYMSGKFGGLPNIKEMDFIFDRPEN